MRKVRVWPGFITQVVEEKKGKQRAGNARKTVQKEGRGNRQVFFFF